MRPGLAVLAIAALTVAVARSGADDKDKDKAKEKAKPPARSYSDEDLKKYKDKPKDEGADAPAGSAGESGAAEESVPGQRRSREYGGYQKLPAAAPPAASPDSQAQEPSQEPPTSVTTEAPEAKSPEEAEWRRRATGAHRPVAEVQGRILRIESEIAQLKDQLNPMSASYVLGGNSIAGPGAVYEIEEKVRNLEAQRTDAKAELLDAEKGWQAFLDEARSAGVNPGWLTP